MALLSAGESITMEQLRSCAFQCAQLLSEHMARTGSTLVALYMKNGPQMIAAVLGVWFQGGAWTPLERKSPHKRLEELVRQVKPAVILCDDPAPFAHLNVPLVCTEQLCFHVVDKSNLCNLVLEEPFDKVAQVIYTSGSTGMPKGVMYTGAWHTPPTFLQRNVEWEAVWQAAVFCRRHPTFGPFSAMKSTQLYAEAASLSTQRIPVTQCTWLM